MSRTEAPFFEQLFRDLAHLSPTSVLEVGFGLGVSAGMIQRHLKPKRHDIVEIDRTLLQDLKKFAARRVGVNAIAGDFWEFRSIRKYDLIFFDPFDYHESGDAYYANDGDERRYLKDKAKRLVDLLKRTGVVCCPYFGAMRPDPLPGFRIGLRRSLRVPPLLLDEGKFSTRASYVCWERG